MSTNTRDIDVEPVVSGITEFSTKLYEKLVATNDGNAIVSPLSVHVLLSALSYGAEGDTRAELLEVLNLPDSKDAHQSYASLIKALNTIPQLQGTPAYSLSLANAAWVSNGYPVKESFSEHLKNQYRAKLQSVDFDKRAEAAALINDWVSQQTNDKIKDLISKDAIEALTRLILTNAVYFKADWENKFNSHVTSEQPFYVDSESIVTVDMMNDIGNVGYFEDELVQVLALPYKGGSVKFVAVLPKVKNGLEHLEKSISADSVKRWITETKDARVDYHIPRFTLTERFELSEVLIALGISNAFDPKKSSFTGITEVEQLYISKVLHEGFIAVDEEGTEAAAATAVFMAGSSYIPDPPKEFRADHPFAFLIVHQPTNTPLFVGRVVKP